MAGRPHRYIDLTPPPTPHKRQKNDHQAHYRQAAESSSSATPSRQDCTSCEGIGIKLEKRRVRDHTVVHKGKTVRRKGFEKNYRVKCSDCKEKGAGIRARERADVKNEAENADASMIDLAQNHLACIICDEEKLIAEYGYKLTESCQHERKACDECLVRWVESKIEEGQWNTITCHECDSPLEYAEISQILMPSSESFKRYDELAMKSCLNSMDEYRHCLNPQCSVGQLHFGGADNPIYCCQICGHKSCTIHNLPWHEGETCTEYDARLQRDAQNTKDDEASAAEVKRRTKRCPKCKAPFEKRGGCDHMTCTRCGHEFCFICLADYAKIIQKGNAFHGADCKYHTSRLG